MTPTQILALINAQIISNGMGAVTGPILGNILRLIVGLFTTPSTPARIVSISALVTVSAQSDFRIGFQRTLNLAPLNAQLPFDANVGQEFVLQDLVGNMSQFPVTVVPPVGMTIVGRMNYVMNEDNQTSRFAYYGSNIWGVEPA